MPRKKPPLPAPKDLIDPDASLKDLSELAQQCRGCNLWERATQAVLGEGAAGAEVMFVGEQPGNREDLEGRPFVGPAGKLLDEALARRQLVNPLREHRQHRRFHLKIHVSKLLL